MLPLLVPLFAACVSHAQTINHKIGVKLCKGLCMERGSCERVAYEPRTLTCQLLSRATGHQKEKGYVMFPKGKHIVDLFTSACSLHTCALNTRCIENYRGRVVCVNDKAVSIPKNRCKMNEDCGSINFVCVRRRCKCAIGYNFNPSDNTCVKGCREYGNRSTLHKGWAISNPNTVGIFRIHTLDSLSGCSQKCYKESRFTCISFVYWRETEQCEHFAFSWWVVPPGQRFKDTSHFGSRHCA